MDLFEYAQKIKQAETPAVKEEAIYSVSEVTREIKDLIVGRFGQERFWVKGEVSNYKGRNQSGHMYFRLKDNDAILNCVFFKGHNSKLKIDLKEGMEVVAQGRMDLWEKGGNYQMIVEEVRQGGTGELFLKFELLKKKLEQEGFFLPEHKKAIPTFSKKIGVVTSATGAVVRDIIHVIRTRSPNVEIFLYPVKVQGEGSAEEIAEAILQLNHETFGLDVMIVGRGGGSIEDLWAFNEEVVAKAIFNSKVPIISAVGHQTDFTIADFVADMRAATPSQAAEMVVPNFKDLEHRVMTYMKNIIRELLHYRELAHEKVYRLIQSPALRDPKNFIRGRVQLVDSLLEQIRQAITEQKRTLKDRHQQANLMLTMLLPQCIPPKRMAFEKAASNLSMLNPLSILSRGYSVVKDAQGKIIKNTDKVAVSDVLTVKLHEGELLLQRYEDIQGLIEKLEDIHQEVSQKDQPMDTMIQKVSEALALYTQFKKEFSQSSFQVKTVKNNGASFVIADFDWKALDHAHPNTRA